MACTKPATGPCTKAPDDDCQVVKTYNAAIPLPDITAITGFDGYFTVAFNDTSTGNVVLLYREEGAIGFQEPRDIVAESVGSISSTTGHAVGTIFKIWLRLETTYEFGPWYKSIAVCDADWDSTKDLVTHFSVIVTHGGEVVLMP